MCVCAQVVSGCEGGVVTIWDIDSGRQVLRFANCHGNNEITALCLDTTGRRLVTGSRDGDIKVIIIILCMTTFLLSHRIFLSNSYFF